MSKSVQIIFYLLLMENRCDDKKYDDDVIGNYVNDFLKKGKVDKRGFTYFFIFFFSISDNISKRPIITLMNPTELLPPPKNP